MLNHQMFKLAAPGAGVIVFRRTHIKNSLEVLLSQRSASVGEGLCITGGGFIECGALNKEPVGTVWLSCDEGYREVCEENPGFDKIINLEEFRSRAQMLTSFSVKTDDANGIHTGTYYGLCLSDTEWDKTKALPPSDERVGMLIPTVITWTEQSLNNHNPAEQFSMDGKDKFYHSHELLPFAALAQLEANGRLFHIA